MGGGGGILSPITNVLFGKPETVATPNFSQAAAQTSAANFANNRVDQNNQYGNLTWQQTGTDAQGNPTWSQNYTSAPFISNAVAAQGGQLMGYANPFSSPTFSSSGDMPSMNYYGSRLNQQQFNPATQLLQLPKFNVNTNIDTSKLAQTGIDPGEDYRSAIMRRLAPEMDRQNAAFDLKMANQGIRPGTEAYENARRVLSQQQNDAMTSATVGGLDMGLRANQQGFGQAAQQIGLNLQGQEQAFNQPLRTNTQNMAANELAYNQQLANQRFGMEAQNQAFTQSMAKYLLPLQVAQGLKNLSAPQFQNYNNIAGTDFMGAMGLTNQSQWNQANAQNATNNAMLGGLFNLAGAGIKKWG